MIRKIIRHIISTIIYCFLKPSIKHFENESIQFKRIIQSIGFHTAIVNNPSIIFKDRSTLIRSKGAIPIYLRYILIIFIWSVKKYYWTSPRRMKMLDKIGINNIYIKNSYLLLKDNIKPYYNEIINTNTPIPVGKKVIYSVMIGEYDELFEPLYVSTNCDYILFTDNKNFKSNVWKVNEIVVDNEKSLKWNVIKYKLLAHDTVIKNYDYSIYIDANIYICGDIIQLFRFVNNKYPISFFKHESNCCVLEEVNKLIELKWVPKDIIEKQYNEYKLKGFNDDLGHIETGVIIRKNNDIGVIKLMEKWFDEFNKYPYRDQLSLMYSIWDTGTKNYHLINEHLWDNQFVIHNKKNHKKERFVY